jgi:regulator of RNase E activity RraA
MQPETGLYGYALRGTEPARECASAPMLRPKFARASMHSGPIGRSIQGVRMSGYVVRTEDLIVDDLDGALVVYDQRRDEVHRLQPA